MKVFISWSGERSRSVADLLDEWLQCVIQAVDPWMSSKDIDRGVLWFNEISDQLADTNIGIVCLTLENRNKPWILFESGSLAKGLTSSRVCTLLIDLQPTDLTNPLAQFNHTLPTKDGIWELVRTINLTLKENALKESILKKVFDTYWPQFEEQFQQIISSTSMSTIKEERQENEIILDILSTVRTLERRLRDMERNNRELHLEPMSLESIHKQVKEYIDMDIPHELIIDLLLNEKQIPRRVVMNAIRAFEQERTRK